MKVVILAGGYGSRLSEYTEKIPKPMVEIGGKPILIHIIEMYARQGFKDFVVALGYKSDYIKRYFYEFSRIAGDILVIIAFLLLQTGRITSNNLSYSLLNLIGSFGVLFSLIYHWNLPAFVIECAWVMISGWAIYNYFSKKKQL